MNYGLLWGLVASYFGLLTWLSRYTGLAVPGEQYGTVDTGCAAVPGGKGKETTRTTVLVPGFKVAARLEGGWPLLICES